MCAAAVVGAGITIDPAYASGGLFLKSIGFSNNAEVARILDIAMNPDSLFMDHRGKRSRNASVRGLGAHAQGLPAPFADLSALIPCG